VRWAAKRDANEDAIVSAVQLAGWKVFKISGKGLPDLMCVRRGAVKMLEIKAKGGTLTESQADRFPLFAANGLPVLVVRTPQEALRALAEDNTDTAKPDQP
jgi:Holliday junction resolvase